MAVVLASQRRSYRRRFLSARDGRSKRIGRGARQILVMQGRGRDAKYLPRGIAAMSSIATTPNAAPVCADPILIKKRESSCELSRIDVIDR